MNNYILCELDENNDLRCDFVCNLLRYSYPNSIKIDTGAEVTLISMSRLGLDESVCMESKERLLKDNRFKYTIMNGVETTYQDITEDTLKSWSFEQKMECKGICFYIRVEDIFVNNYPFNKAAGVYVSFDNNCDNLLGMDLLRHFDFHIGVSNVTGKCTFIGCLKDRINKEYLDALFTHFGYLSKDIIEQTCKDIREQALQEGTIIGYKGRYWKNYVHRRNPKKIDRSEVIK